MYFQKIIINGVNKNGPKRLELLEEIYKIRNTITRFDNSLLRILANHYNTEKGNEYRKLAYIHTAEELLRKDLTLEQMTEYAYLAAHYAKMFGNEEEVKGYSSLLDDIIAGSEKNKDIKDYALYLKKLLDNKE